MIIIINKYCFFKKQEIGNAEKFQKFLGVRKSSYAGDVASRLYFQYFGNSTNIRKYYNKYYKSEFNSIQDFLECKFNITKDDAQKIAAGDYWFSSFENKYDDVKYSLDFDESLVGIFEKYVGGIRNENKNRICYK